MKKKGKKEYNVVNQFQWGKRDSKEPLRHKDAGIDSYMGQLDRHCKVESLDNLVAEYNLMSKKYQVLVREGLDEETLRYYRTRIKIVNDWKNLKLREKMEGIRQPYIDVDLEKGEIIIDDGDMTRYAIFTFGDSGEIKLYEKKLKDYV